MTIVWNLILWASMIWLPWLLYAMLRGEGRPKKNIIVGVTLPYEAQSDPAVKALLERYQKELRGITWLTMIPAIPCLFIRSIGVSMTLLMTWIVVVCFVPCIPYIRCNRALACMKAERGWKRSGSAQSVIDLRAAAEEMRWISPLWFLPPFLISFVPLFFDRTLWWLWLLGAGLVALFYLCYRFLYRSRAEMVDGDTERTIALTRVRRYNWGKAWLICAWATGIFHVALWLTLDHIWMCLTVTLVYGLVVSSALLGIELRVRRLQEKLSKGSGGDVYVDEDDHWIWGMIYYNPNDSHLLVNARIGINSTFNLAKRSGQVIAAVILLLLLACPLTGVWIMGLERAPVELTVTESAVVASHFGSEWAVMLEDIQNAELLTALPPIRRVAGTAVESARTGSWSSDSWGKFTCCIDPRVGPWLLLRTSEGKLYLFGSSSPGVVREAAGRLPVS